MHANRCPVSSEGIPAVAADGFAMEKIPHMSKKASMFAQLANQGGTCNVLTSNFAAIDSLGRGC